MANFGTFKTEIASEIDRADLDTEIGTAIIAAITEYETTKFTFNQATDATITTTAGEGTVSLPTGFLSMVSIKYVFGGYYEFPEYQNINWIEENDNDPNYTSRPEYYTIFAQLLRLYPVPDATYTLQIHYYRTFTDPSADGDTSVWFDEAYNLIKYKAKAFLYGNVLEDPSQAAYYQTLADLERDRLTERLNTQQQTYLMEAN